MIAEFAWIRPEPGGLYIRPADVWVDPTRAVPRALITHGHADHARSGHGVTMATAATLAIMRERYGNIGLAETMAYGERVAIGGGVHATCLPAGHVLGSAQILFECCGERVIVTGDFKRQPDPTCAPFEIAACDVLITEATFGLPVFRHPPIGAQIARLLAAREAAAGRAILVGAYALGKAQRVIAELRVAGYHDPIWLHGAMERMCRLYEAHGVALGDLRSMAGVPKAVLEGAIVLCPPSALADRWSRRLPDPLTAMASGWMRVRQRARQRGVELPLIISDHADWDELTATITEIAPRETWITHGREEALLRWCELHQRSARALSLVGYEEGSDEDERA
ncbi:ligase-associated DNA damage response exonuclease [Novosphingobium sp. FSW06-99]|uniref:ligase-associated DNA damage response exonuclease n=1 Tax=Novosphingobium sp. FSW06-99 TaxID=1739113 RepID=UPI00076BD5ED|nr:ligase-associated DNA damage response exonuclease [Novosphingobium sp. FSW06-99]KUR76006.1 DNA ligase-associated DEXH box helicase [Novosphingobium sp. FSW06-99]